MRNVPRAQSFLGLLALSAVSATVMGVSCANTAEDCASIGVLCPGQTAITTSSSSSGDTDGGVPLCEQSPRDNPGSVIDACGVFVKSGAGAGGTGSMTAPLPLLKQGIELAKMQNKKRIYACVGSYTEILKLPAGMTLYGGLNCESGWAVGDVNSTLKGAPDKIPLTLESGVDETSVENFDVTAVNAALPGGSSIAALALDGSTVRFENSKLTAGDAQKGADGTSADSTPPAVPPPSGAGANACATMNSNPGGSATPNVCDPDPLVNEYSVGGDGGNGKTTSGSPGVDGESNPVTMAPLGVGGKAGSTTMMPAVLCGEGGAGANGTAGVAGTGAEGPGTLDPLTGWVGVAGGDGKKGTPGQGGGGGGGQNGKTTLPSACAGASGGAGGAGGCGGAGGKGGAAGGSSIALASINSTITMVNVTITTGKGGAGGLGGMYQSGGTGGAGGDGGTGTTKDGVTLAAACKGGMGGNGGSGGPGGGGAGGHTLGIAYVGKAPTADKVTFTIPADGAGAGGLGGDNNAQNNGGAAGQSQTKLEFVPTP